MTKKQLAESINWKKTWDELTALEKNNFLIMHDIDKLPEKDIALVKRLFATDKKIVETKGIEKLDIYIS